MIHQLLNTLSRAGIWGFFLVSVIEGLSIPFPSVLAVTTYGYVLNPTMLQLFVIAAGASLIYTVFSYIPYIIARKLQSKIVKRFEKKMQKAQRLFHKYGEWSIPLCRLLGMGYISFIAGICKVSPKRYGLLTFAGNYTWTLIMLWLGRIYKGNIQVVMRLFQEYRTYIWFILLIIGIVFAVILFQRRKVNVV